MILNSNTSKFDYSAMKSMIRILPVFVSFFAYEASNIICKQCNRKNSLRSIWNHA